MMQIHETDPTGIKKIPKIVKSLVFLKYCSTCKTVNFFLACNFTKYSSVSKILSPAA